MQKTLYVMDTRLNNIKKKFKLRKKELKFLGGERLVKT